MINVDDILKLVNAGFTKAEIMQLSTAPASDPASADDPASAGDPAPAPASKEPEKIGKTDIHIEFENKAAFIGECKIWHGERLFQGAIQQVINYSTWRDLKVSVIIFNKENQSFPAILSKIKSWADANTTAYTQPQTNIWKCKYHRQDMNVDIQLTILVFDLYVDKTQFNDIRYRN